MVTTKMRKVLGLALAGLVMTSLPQMVSAQEGTPRPEGTRPEGGRESIELTRATGRIFRVACNPPPPGQSLANCCAAAHAQCLRLFPTPQGKNACDAREVACRQGSFVP